MALNRYTFAFALAFAAMYGLAKYLIVPALFG